jgi:hypothetical protein
MPLFSFSRCSQSLLVRMRLRMNISSLSWASIAFFLEGLADRLDGDEGSGVDAVTFGFGFGRGRGRLALDIFTGNDAWEIPRIEEVIRKSRASISMASSPVIFKRTKAKTALRARQSSPDNDSETAGTANGDDSPSTLATKLKIKVKKKPRSRLSFGGDDDEVCVHNAH